MFDFYLVKKQQVVIDDLYSDKPDGRYWYKNGYNPAAIKALIAGFVVALLFVVIPQLFFLASFSWGIGAAVGATTYVKLMKGQGGLAVARDERGRRKMALNGGGPTPLAT